MTKQQDSIPDWRDERDAEPDLIPEPDHFEPVNTLV